MQSNPPSLNLRNNRIQSSQLEISGMKMRTCPRKAERYDNCEIARKSKKIKKTSRAVKGKGMHEKFSISDTSELDNLSLSLLAYLEKYRIIKNPHWYDPCPDLDS